MNINSNSQNSQAHNHSLIYNKNNEDSNQHMNNTTTNNFNNPITADTTAAANWDTQCPLELTRDITYAPQTHTQCQFTNNLYLIGSDTLHTGMGASRIESLAGPEVEQGQYPQEAAMGVTPAMTDLLTTPQSGGQKPRIGHGSSTEQPQELPASPKDQADADVMQLNERRAQTAHSARNWKESNTTNDLDTWRVRRRRQRY